VQTSFCRHVRAFIAESDVRKSHWQLFCRQRYDIFVSQ